MIGLAFLTKMLQGFLIVPALALAYLWAAPTTLGRRCSTCSAAAGGICWWQASYVALFQLTPASERPYMAARKTTASWSSRSATTGWAASRVQAAAHPAAAGGPRRQGGNVGFGGAAGITRMFGTSFGGEVSWLLPAALILLGRRTLVHPA